jgi:hypothetical protein
MVNRRENVPGDRAAGQAEKGCEAQGFPLGAWSKETALKPVIFTPLAGTNGFSGRENTLF